MSLQTVCFVLGFTIYIANLGLGPIVFMKISRNSFLVMIFIFIIGKYFSTGCVKEKDVTVRDHSRIGIYNVENMEACAMLSVTTEGAPYWSFDKHYKEQHGRCYLFKSNSDRLWVEGLVTGNRRCGKYLPMHVSRKGQKSIDRLLAP